MTQASPDGSARPSAVAATDGPPPETLFPSAHSAPAHAAGQPVWPPLGAYPGETAYPAETPDPRETQFSYAAEPYDYDDDRSTVQFPAATDAEPVEGDIVWHQPAPSEPFRAKHEKPGEWHTHPPDHLAFEHSPPAEIQPGVQHDPAAEAALTEAIPLSMLPQPWQVPFDPQHAEPHPAPAPAPQQRRTGRWVALAVVLTLLLLAGGAVSAVLLLRDADSGKGSPDPATAVDRFLTEIYTRQDATAAAGYVCREARDQAKLEARVDQVRGYAVEYPAPSFSWGEPAVSANTGERARVDVRLTLTTDDERSAQQQLSFLVIHKTGWLVCDADSRA